MPSKFGKQAKKRSFQETQKAKRKKDRITDDGHTSQEQLPNKYLEAEACLIEHARFYIDRTYYKVHFKLRHNQGSDLEPIYLHKKNGIDLKQLIKDFKARNRPRTKVNDLSEMEWEVEEILSSRMGEDGQNEYLVKWRHWIGSPSWINEDDCDCVSLIAFYENPKLKRICNFDSNNRALWVDNDQMHLYVQKLIGLSNVNLLDTRDKDCESWRDHLTDGLNIGCTRYENHWYVTFIFQNTHGVTNTILLADSLNTSVTQKLKHHPILLRLRKAMPNCSIRSILMTQMDRADMCAYYVLAAIERGLFIFDSRAKFIPESINFHPVRAELLRSLYAPETNNEISLSLRSKTQSLPCPICEFCRSEYENFIELDKHIEENHFIPETKPHSRQFDNQTSPIVEQELCKTLNANYLIE